MMNRYKVTAADFLNNVARTIALNWGSVNDHPAAKRLVALAAVLEEPVSVKDVPTVFSGEAADGWLAGYRACQERMNRDT